MFKRYLCSALFKDPMVPLWDVIQIGFSRPSSLFHQGLWRQDVVDLTMVLQYLLQVSFAAQQENIDATCSSQLGCLCCLS